MVREWKYIGETTTSALLRLSTPEWSKEYTDNKSFAEDLTEGKFSFPIIHAIQQHPEDPRIMNILKKRTTDLEIKKYAVDVLEKLGSFAYTKQFMEQLDAE